MKKQKHFPPKKYKRFFPADTIRIAQIAEAFCENRYFASTLRKPQSSLKLDGQGEARLIALACSDFSQWKLLAEYSNKVSLLYQLLIPPDENASLRRWSGS